MDNGYWQRACRKAWSYTVSELHLNSRASTTVWLLGTAAVLAGLAFLGSKDAAWDEFAVRAILVFVTLGVIPFVFAYKLIQTPPLLESEANTRSVVLHDALSSRIEQLERRLRPVLQIEFVEHENKHFETIHDGELQYQVGRIAVRNTSNSETVEDVDVTLIHYKKHGESIHTTIDKKLVADSIGQQVVDIHSRRAENFNLFRVRADVPGACLCFGPFPNTSYVKVTPGRYRVKVTASGKSVPRCDAYYLIEALDDGPITFRIWQVGDTEH
jgi:hypothetical protein